MDWQSLIVGALIGGVVAVVLQNVLFPLAQSALLRRSKERHYRRLHREWLAVEQKHSRLKLVQSGWDRDGCFQAGTITLRLCASDYKPNVSVVNELRNAHAGEWERAGLTNGQQMGVSRIDIARKSDDPDREQAGRAHAIVLDVHRYYFFDFLATHILRLKGNTDEQAILDGLAGIPSPERPVAGFPTPLSVGVSLFCEDGGCLVLTRRSESAGAGGYWGGGQIFNAVGENLVWRDFVNPSGTPSETTPEVVAWRGLREEMGLPAAVIAESSLRLHSFAWAPDLLDFKFFGYLRTSLSRGALYDYWRLAPDRCEGAPFFVDVRSQQECDNLLAIMGRESEAWAPEAVFSTVRSLLVLRRISASSLQALRI